jgi:hypothetical protein
MAFTDTKPFATMIPTGAAAVASHQRLTVTTANLLETFTGYSALTVGGRKPTGLYLATEKGAADVYITWDATGTPSATLGYVVPAIPGAPMYIPFGPVGFQTGTIKLASSSGTSFVQLKWEWDY